MITASMPIPAITAKWSGGPPSTLNWTRSTALSRPSKATSRAAPSSSGMPMFLASRFPVPAGMSPNGTPVLARPEQITRMVPSPPAPSTRSTPASTACRVIARPGSSVVVSNHIARSQPRELSSYSTCRRKVTQSRTLVGLKITAARGAGPVMASGTARLRTSSPTSSCGDGTLTPAASSAAVVTNAPYNAPPMMSERKCAPVSQRSTPTASTSSPDPTCQTTRARTVCRVTAKVAPTPMDSATAPARCPEG